MKVDVRTCNIALVRLIDDPTLHVTLDANFLIQPDRRPITPFCFKFTEYRSIWLDPIFQSFSSLAIHEAVRRELIDRHLVEFISAQESATPPRLVILRDSSLSEIEKALRDEIENRIHPLTKYDPALDNKDDRGEVKTLSYMAAKGLLHFATHDAQSLQLIEKAEDWNTGLDGIQAVRAYELIYYLCKKGNADRRSLRLLYKYQYHLTDKEKRDNPEWGEFYIAMESLYAARFL
jgi:hypothetical protein